LEPCDLGHDRITDELRLRPTALIGHGSYQRPAHPVGVLGVLIERHLVAIFAPLVPPTAGGLGRRQFRLAAPGRGGRVGSGQAGSPRRRPVLLTHCCCPPSSIRARCRAYRSPMPAASAVPHSSRPVAASRASEITTRLGIGGVSTGMCCSPPAACRSSSHCRPEMVAASCWLTITPPIVRAGL